MFRSAMVLALVSSLLLIPAEVNAQSTNSCEPGQSPTYTFGFADLKARIGDAMGSPLTCEFADPNGTGDVHQETSKGLAFWRKSTNTPTFTDGFTHWGHTAQGWAMWTGSSIDPPADQATVYPDALVQGFTDACTGGDPSKQPLCQCAINKIQAQYSLGQFVVLAQGIQGGDLPPELASIAIDCAVAALLPSSTPAPPPAAPVTPPPTATAPPPAAPAPALAPAPAPPTNTAPKVGSRENPVPMGAAADLSDGWRVVVISTQPNATSAILSSNRFNKPPAADHQFFIARVQATYTGAGSKRFDGSFRLRAVGASAVSYRSFEDSCGVFPDPISNTEVFSGGTITGNACWSIRSADAGSLLMFDQSPFSSDQNRVFFALTPPGR
jgi:hypothetical protein